MLIDPNRRDILLWTRIDNGWDSTRHADPQGTIDLGTLGLTLDMEAIYDGVPPDAGPPLLPGSPD